MNSQNTLSVKKAVLIFFIATLWFFLLLLTLFPWMRSQFTFNGALYWFITGFFLFIPLFAYAIIAVKAEGNQSAEQIRQALYIRKLTRQDFMAVIYGLLGVFISSGLIFGGSMLLHKYTGIRQLNTVPWFMEMSPFQGSDKLLLLVWLPMFFFNIVGEELLWRGYIQARLKIKNAWLLISLLWIGFHLPFGLDLLMILLPITLILPYVFHKTHNTLTGILIHGIYNGPIFVAVALGLMK
ncbi:CPBP family intramembrane glutamic endopeptidase [bacterium]